MQFRSKGKIVLFTSFFISVSKKLFQFEMNSKILFLHELFLVT